MGLITTIRNALIPRAEGGQPSADSDFWYEPIPGDASSGIRITPALALKASAVFACVKVLAETVASLPLHIFERLPDGGKRPAPSHPLEDVIAFQPNDVQTGVEFWEQMMLDAALRGTAYAEKVQGRRGPVDQLIPLDADRVQHERLPNGRLRFRYSDPVGQTRVLLQDDVFRIPGLSSTGSKGKGLRAVDFAADAIGLSIAAETYGARFFRNNAQPSIVLQHPKNLSTDAAKNIVQQWMQRLGGAGNHRPVVLWEGMEAKVISSTARESQLNELRKFQIAEVARFFRIPLHMLNVFEGVTKSNVEQQSLDLVRYTLRPWVKRIEMAIRRDLLVAPQRFTAKYTMEGLLRGDSQARASFYASGIQNGWMTRNEARVAEGLNKLDGLDEPLTPLNMGGAQGGGGRRDGAPDQQAVLPAPVPLLESAADRVVSREVNAIGKMLAKVKDADALKSWASSFYGTHVAYVAENLAVGEDIARVYCEYQRDELMRAADTWGHNGCPFTPLTELLDRWEATRAAELAETLAKGRAA